MSLFVAGAIFGEVGVSLFVAGAIFGEVGVTFSWQSQHFVKFWEIAGAPNVVFFHAKCVSKMGRVRWRKRRAQCEMTILCSDMFGYVRIMLESSLYWRKQFRGFPLTS